MILMGEWLPVALWHLERGASLLRGGEMKAKEVEEREEAEAR